MGDSVSCCKQDNDFNISSREILTLEGVEVASKIVQEFFKKYPRIKEIYNRKASYCPSIDRSLVNNLGEMTLIGNLPKQGSTESLVLYNEGYLYEGELKDLAREGCGRLISADGDCYEGKWRGNEPDGEGTYEATQSKQKYSGLWSNGALNGRGRACYDDGSVYQGEFYQNMRHGKGRILYVDGTIYDGDFKSNLMEGFGTLIGRNHKYEGSWRGGKMHGGGKSYWYNEDDELVEIYDGAYENGIKQGQGEYRWANGRIFKGEWENGQIKKGAQVEGWPKPQ